jgi:hypothetical protein
LIGPTSVALLPDINDQGLAAQTKFIVTPKLTLLRGDLVIRQNNSLHSISALNRFGSTGQHPRNVLSAGPTEFAALAANAF